MTDFAAPLDWTEPGLWPVAPGIYRVPLPIPNDGLHAVNVYVIESGDSLALIDAGWAHPDTKRRLVEQLHRLDGGLDAVRDIAVTHGHRDHYSLAMELRDDGGARVLLGSAERPMIEAVLGGSGRGLEAHFGLLQQAGADGLVADLREWLVDPPDYARADDRYEMPDTWLGHGDPVTLGDRTLTALHTPGHTAGHLVYADLEAGLLFAGDHLLPHITPSISFEPVRRPNPLGLYLSSLHDMLALPDLMLLPAHGPVAVSSHVRALALIEHHETRLAQMRDAVRRGAETTADIAADVTWTGRARRLGELNIFNRMLAILETQFHLDELVTRGEVAPSGGPHPRRYRRTGQLPTGLPSRSEPGC